MAGIYLLGFAAAVFFFIKRKAYRKYAGILMIGSGLAFCIWIIGQQEEKERFLFEILREEKDGREKNVEVEAEAGGEKELIQLKLAAQDYQVEELEALEHQLWEKLEQKILGKNNSPDNVTSDLYFPKKEEGYPFIFRWSSNKPELLTQEGKVSADIPKEGELAKVCVYITAEGNKFEKERRFYVQLFPPQTREAFWSRLQTYLQEKEEASREILVYQLPETFEGESIRFQEKAEDKSGLIFILSVVAVILSVWAQKQEKEKQKRLREEEIEQEYPHMVVRMAMLADTGMTISGVFKRIAGEYGRKRQKKERPLYEEMLITCREMDSGIAEKTAYQNMGRRCGLNCIVRFTALLVQYTQTGSAGLKRALQEESEHAMRERKEHARCKGEEAGTKLLVPMMLMLVLVMVMIMIPAFTSFGV